MEDTSTTGIKVYCRTHNWEVFYLFDPILQPEDKKNVCLWFFNSLVGSFQEVSSEGAFSDLSQIREGSKTFMAILSAYNEWRESEDGLIELAYLNQKREQPTHKAQRSAPPGSYGFMMTSLDYDNLHDD